MGTHMAEMSSWLPDLGQLQRYEQEGKIIWWLRNSGDELERHKPECGMPANATFVACMWLLGGACTSKHRELTLPSELQLNLPIDFRDVATLSRCFSMRIQLLYVFFFFITTSTPLDSSYEPTY